MNVIASEATSYAGYDPGRAQEARDAFSDNLAAVIVRERDEIDRGEFRRHVFIVRSAIDEEHARAANEAIGKHVATATERQ